MTRKEIIRVEELTRDYVTPANTFHILKGIDLEIAEQEYIAIMGKSGSGKTTLLKLLGMIDRPTSGNVYFENRNRKNIDKDQLAEIRRNNIGFVYQDYYLMDSLSVRENIMLPMVLDHRDINAATERVNELAEIVDVSALLDKRVYELSGGEKQRVSICRALANNPDLVIADEPTGNLDTKTSDAVMSYLTMMNRQYGKTIVLVTHDAYVASYCDRVIFLKDGVIDSEILKADTQEKFFEKIMSKQRDILR